MRQTETAGPGPYLSEQDSRSNEVLPEKLVNRNLALPALKAAMRVMLNQKPSNIKRNMEMEAMRNGVPAVGARRGRLAMTRGMAPRAQAWPGRHGLGP
jgi:hypothetical protein